MFFQYFMCRGGVAAAGAAGQERCSRVRDRPQGAWTGRTAGRGEVRLYSAGRGGGTRRDPRESREPRPTANGRDVHTLRLKCTGRVPYRYRPDCRDGRERSLFGAAYTAVYIRRSWSVLYKGLTPFAHAERRMSASMK